MAGTILLVEDDFALAMGTEYALEAEGYEVLHAVNLDEARKYAGISADGDWKDKKQPDLILLDVMLPDGSGFDLCREIRSTNQQIPIIFLTAVGEEVNIVQGLELGADDYVTKPYRVKELLSRISANLRRAGIVSQSKPESYSFGRHCFLMKELRLLYKGQVVELTPSELRLLKELIQNEGLVLTRNQLLERLYDTGENFVDDNTLSVYMKRLRDKLGEDAERIETVRGIGYRFRKE
ncbi:MAG: response regulator transcription factor [Lachnospiraceae bacterium]|nr:response regulator transcription factor [Lachnospiraceae bacterium]